MAVAQIDRYVTATIVRNLYGVWADCDDVVGPRRDESFLVQSAEGRHFVVRADGSHQEVCK